MIALRDDNPNNNKARETNPRGLEGKPSFGEMVEQVFHAKGTLQDVFALMEKTWGTQDHPFGPERLAKHFEDASAIKPPSGKPLKDLFQNSAHRLFGKGYDTLGKLISLFQLSERRQLMLYRIASGELPFFDPAHAERLLDAALADRDDPVKRSDAIRMLHEASGLTSSHALIGINKRSMDYFLAGQQLMRDTAFAEKLSRIYIPDFLDVDDVLRRTIRKKFVKVFALFPPMTLSERIEAASKSANSSHEMCCLLIGRRSLYGLSTSDAAKKLGCEVNWLKNRFMGKTQISETDAEKICSLFDLTDAEKIAISDLLIGIPKPQELLRSVKNGKITFELAAQMMRARKGLKQTDLEGPGLSENTIIKIEMPGETVFPRHAKAHADFFFPIEKRGDEYYWHISYAAGYPPKTKFELLASLKNMNSDPKPIITHALVLNGMGLGQFSQAYDVRYKSINRLCERRAGPETLAKLAAAIQCDPADLMALGVYHRKSHKTVLRETIARTPANFCTVDDGGSVYDRLGLG